MGVRGGRREGGDGRKVWGRCMYMQLISLSSGCVMLVLVQANNSPSTSRKLDRSHDMERLKEIFFQLQDVRDDSQQRGWAVHDDQEAIMEYLRELLQILVRTGTHYHPMMSHDIMQCLVILYHMMSCDVT